VELTHARILCYGRSLERHLTHFGILDAGGAPLAFTDWAPLAQDRAGWRILVTKPPFAIGKPHVRQPRCTYFGVRATFFRETRELAAKYTELTMARCIRKWKENPSSELDTKIEQRIAICLTHVPCFKGVHERSGGDKHEKCHFSISFRPLLYSETIKLFLVN
jgi:hypothetical protein